MVRSNQLKTRIYWRPMLIWLWRIGRKALTNHTTRLERLHRRWPHALARYWMIWLTNFAWIRDKFTLLDIVWAHTLPEMLDDISRDTWGGGFRLNIPTISDYRDNNNINWRVFGSRITGLDPASPLYWKWSPDAIRETDGRFVDIIHTCGEALGEIWPR